MRCKSSSHDNFCALSSLPAADEPKHKHCLQPSRFSPISRTPWASLSTAPYSAEDLKEHLLRDYTKSVCAKAMLFALFFVNQRKQSKPDTAFRLPKEIPFLLHKEQQLPQMMPLLQGITRKAFLFFPPPPLRAGKGERRIGNKLAVPPQINECIHTHRLTVSASLWLHKLEQVNGYKTKPQALDIKAYATYRNQLGGILTTRWSPILQVLGSHSCYSS